MYCIREGLPSLRGQAASGYRHLGHQKIKIKKEDLLRLSSQHWRKGTCGGYDNVVMKPVLIFTILLINVLIKALCCYCCFALFLKFLLVFGLLNLTTIVLRLHFYLSSYLASRNRHAEASGELPTFVSHGSSSSLLLFFFWECS